jgi:glutathione reductase (NADPH)
MQAPFDLLIIGTGTAAMVAATRLRQAGWRVGVVDFRPFGGTCALRGCDPKKMLVSGAMALDYARRMSANGVVGQVSLDWRDLMAFKSSFTDPISAAHEQRYADQGIDTFHGAARFLGSNTLRIGEETMESRHILIASGAQPVRLSIPGEEHLATNEDFLALEQLPRRIVLVGGGYIASEFAHVAARAGAKVTILQRGPRMLTQFEPELVAWLMESFRWIGVDVRLNTTVESVERIGDAEPVAADLVIHAAGRAPALDELDLDAAGVERQNGRLKLNAFLQSTSNPAVYAAGDAAQTGPPLTPVSSHDAKVVAANLLDGNRHMPDYRGVPSVAFTIPPIARVGLTEADATAQGLKFRVNSRSAPDWFTARQAAEPIYGFKVLLEHQTDRILGAHLVGPQVDEVINLFALAIRNELPAEALRQMMFAYPTGASDIGYML